MRGPGAYGVHAGIDGEAARPLFYARFAGGDERPPARGEVAQLVEQRTENPRVVGSIPTLATILDQLARERPRGLPDLLVLLQTQTKELT